MQPLRLLSTLGLLIVLAPSAVSRAATHGGRSVDGRWFDGRVVSTTFGAYDCQVRFNGDVVNIKLTAIGVQIQGELEDEAIADPHDITIEDPKRGVNWTLDCFNLSR